MDYRKFLGAKSTRVLPYLGGLSVDSKDRRLRVKGISEPGWYQFVVAGRQATIDPAMDNENIEVPDLSDLPIVRGHLSGQWLFVSGAKVEKVYLLPDDQPMPLSPCLARRWYSGQLLFEQLEFEDEAEDLARRQLLQRQSLIVDGEALKGIHASLRAAFGYQLLITIAQEQNVYISPHEVLGDLRNIGFKGKEEAQRLINQVELRRQQERQRVAQLRQQGVAQLRQQAVAARAASRHQRTQNREQRIFSALENTGANMLNVRFMGEGQVETAFDFMGEHFIAIVEEDSLQVFDAGVCLEGADSELTLDSLPGVIREAIETGQLYITRH